MDPELTETLKINDTEPEQRTFRFRWYWWMLIICADIILIAAGCIYWLSTPPNNFQAQRVLIEPGESVSSIVAILADANIVRSPDLLYGIILYNHSDTTIKAGVYTFAEPQSVWSVAKYITTTIPTEELVRLTFPEGMRASAYASIASTTLEKFDAETFLVTANEREGYLWPETYFVPEDYSAEQLLALFSQEYTSGTADLRTAINTHPLTEYEILTLASIVEREANSAESMYMVSGILQNRLAIGMALQADATMEYIIDTPLGELPPGQLAAELRTSESPYNTYKNTGLPPTPIGNPGRLAIEAVLNPTPSDYFFYITDEDGVFHYAKTLQEHNFNIARYLR